MKKYKVSMYYEERGYKIVEAKNKKQAEKIVFEAMGDEGNQIEECKDRDYNVCNVELVRK